MSVTGNLKPFLHEIRHALQTLIEQGDKPAIDSIEAGITLKNRQLSLEESRFKLLKAKLELSNFLWTKDNLPLELEDNLIPEKISSNLLE